VRTNAVSLSLIKGLFVAIALVVAVGCSGEPLSTREKGTFIGTGVGAGIVLNRRLFRGVNWNAGEIGYMLVPGTIETKRETGHAGSLEEMIGGEGIRAQWRILWNEEATPLPSSLLATEIFDHAMQGDALALTILARTARFLFYAIYNIWSVLNCPLFVLGGGVGLHPSLCEATREILEQWDFRERPRVMLSSLGEDAQVLGAIRTALDTAALTVGARRFVSGP